MPRFGHTQISEVFRISSSFAFTYSLAVNIPEPWVPKFGWKKIFGSQSGRQHPLLQAIAYPSLSHIGCHDSSLNRQSKDIWAFITLEYCLEGDLISWLFSKAYSTTELRLQPGIWSRQHRWIINNNWIIIRISAYRLHIFSILWILRTYRTQYKTNQKHLQTAAPKVFTTRLMNQYEFGSSATSILAGASITISVLLFCHMYRSRKVLVASLPGPKSPSFLIGMKTLCSDYTR